MRTLLIAAAVLISATLLPACATYDPEVVCTTDWIGSRADRAVGEITKDTSRVVRNFRKVAVDVADGGTPGPLRLLSLSRSLKSLERELTDGRGIRDLKTLARTCDDPAIVTRGLDSWLDRQQLGPTVTSFIRDSGILNSLAQLQERSADTAG